MFVLSVDSVGYNDGGLTIILKNDKERGILIYGYNDLGEWITYLQVGNKVIYGHLDYFDYPYKVYEIIRKYNIFTWVFIISYTIFNLIEKELWQCVNLMF